MKTFNIFSALAILIAISSAFIATNDKPEYIPPEKQRSGGDSATGFNYLITGDYIKSGIPYKAFIGAAGKSKTNFLQRKDLNENISHEFTAVKATNGEVVVAPNCLQCHAQVFEGKLVVGLGNSLIDFTDKRLNRQNLIMLERFLKLTSRQQYEAAENFITVSKAVGPFMHAEVRGVNLADHLSALLVSHRDPVNFKWFDQPLFSLPPVTIPTDTPPWWLLKKKHAMFYNGLGRGDFGRFLMASNLLTVKDTVESAEVDRHMPDVLAFITSLKPPSYPKQLDNELVKKGKTVFLNNCAGCHGKYGEGETYPNLLIPATIIQTDTLLFSSNYSNSQFLNWFNRSWFTMGDHPARLQPYRGYIAPPLDGIWISAPYLHNGSVPDLTSLLNSKLRTKWWTRNFEKPEYDYNMVGWKAYEPMKPMDGMYNTELPGYSNSGHYFGDHLTDAERKAVIEYLKTL